MIKNSMRWVAVFAGCYVLAGCGPYKMTLPPPDLDPPKEKASGLIQLSTVTSNNLPRYENYYAMRFESAPAAQTEYYTEDNPVQYLETSVKSCLTNAGYEVIAGEQGTAKTPDLKLSVNLDGEAIATKYQANWAGIAVGLATGIAAGAGGDTTRAAVVTTVNMQRANDTNMVKKKVAAADRSSIHLTKAGGAERSFRLAMEKYCEQLLAAIDTFRKTGK